MIMILGVDLGTSGLKCVITNLNEEIVCSTSTKLNINQFNGNCFEQNPEDWIVALETCLHNLKLENIDFSNIEAISFSAQMLGCIIIDEQGNEIDGDQLIGLIAENWKAKGPVSYTHLTLPTKSSV